MMFFFRKKLDKMIDLKGTDKKMSEMEPELEKGDKLAIVLAIFVVIGPILLALLGIVGLLLFLFTS